MAPAGISRRLVKILSLKKRAIPGHAYVFSTGIRQSVRIRPA